MSGFPAHFPIAMHEKLVALQAAVSSIERRLEAHTPLSKQHMIVMLRVRLMTNSIVIRSSCT